VWPKYGFWSASESSVPVECKFPPACPGYSVINVLTQAGGLNTEAGFNTRLCAIGYQGDFCASCAVNYYRSGPTCKTCGLTDEDKAELVNLCIGLVCWFAVMALGATLLRADDLCTFITVILVIQQLSAVGQKVSLLVPELNSLEGVFRATSFLNFNIELAKPGCAIPRLPYSTVIFVCACGWLLCWLFFVLAAGLKLLYFHCKEKKKPNSRKSALRAFSHVSHGSVGETGLSFEAKFEQPSSKTAKTAVTSNNRSALSYEPASTPASIKVPHLAASPSMKSPHLAASPHSHFTGGAFHQRSSTGSSGFHHRSAASSGDVVLIGETAVQIPVAKLHGQRGDSIPPLAAGSVAPFEKTSIAPAPLPALALESPRHVSSVDPSAESEAFFNPPKANSSSPLDSEQDKSSSRPEQIVSPALIVQSLSPVKQPKAERSEKSSKRKKHKDFHRRQAISLNPTSNKSGRGNLLMMYTRSLLKRSVKLADFHFKDEFKYRIIHSSLIVFSVWFFRFSLLCVEGLHCITAEGTTGATSVLSTSKSISCYTGDHTLAAVLAWSIAIVYLILAPMAIFAYLSKHHKQESFDHTEHSRNIKRFGFLTKQVRPVYHWWRMTSYLSSILIAICDTVVNDFNLSLFLVSLVFIVFKCVLVVYLRPFSKLRPAVIQIAIGLCVAVYGIVMLYRSLQSEQQQVYNSTSVYILVLQVCTGFTLYVLFWVPFYRNHREYLRSKCQVCSRRVRELCNCCRQHPRADIPIPEDPEEVGELLGVLPAENEQREEGAEGPSLLQEITSEVLGDRVPPVDNDSNSRPSSEGLPSVLPTVLPPPLLSPEQEPDRQATRPAVLHMDNRIQTVVEVPIHHKRAKLKLKPRVESLWPWMKVKAKKGAAVQVKKDALALAPATPPPPKPVPKPATHKPRGADDPSLAAMKIKSLKMQRKLAAMKALLNNGNGGTPTASMTNGSAVPAASSTRSSTERVYRPGSTQSSATSSRAASVVMVNLLSKPGPEAN